jgi:tetratricopeptide (TPR) repeat protein
MRIDPVRMPITWCRASAQRGAALCGLGDLEAASERIAAGVNALTAAVEHLPSEHSPLDSARIAQKLGHALMTLSVALDDERLCDTSIASFDQALQLFEGAANIAERSICAFDRASAIAAQAERRGDVSSLNYAERVFKQELAAVDPRRDPVAWAVMQVALARVYAARADLLGDPRERSNAMLALSEALDLFTERGMRSLADATLTALDQIKASV